MFVGRAPKTLLSSIINSNITLRCRSTAADESAPYAQYVFNRNPRNLEKMRIAYKPAGYHLDKPGNEFWHK